MNFSIRLGITLPALLLLAWMGLGQANSFAAEVDFIRDVRPILSDKCFKCHGPDDKNQKGGLRLDLREEAMREMKSGARAIVPGKPAESEMVVRILSNDPDEMMPPAKSKITLTEAQKSILQQWIAQGAEYKPHWAFVPPQPAPLPAVKRTDWPRNPIDQFVLAKLEAKGLSPTPEADRATLIRRLSLDLIGLPPTPAEVDAFVSDSSADAYDKLVDRLLASPHYGERWARRWLDLARYADTNGYEKDRHRTIWPYRDWVIRALNADMPFDQFTIEQIAGDMLPHATPEQIIATGFHRNTMVNEEGGIDPQEFRYYAMVDRVNTTGAAWLGLTLACAQCHTHKYDPITHREYFQLMAFLNNADEPDYEVPDAAVQQRRLEAQAKIQKLLAELPGKWPAPSNIDWQVTKPKVTSAAGQAYSTSGDGTVRASGAAAAKDTVTLQWTEAAPAQADRLKLEVIREKNAGPGRTAHGNFVLSELVITYSPPGGQPQPVKLKSASASFSQAGFEIEKAIDGDTATGWAIDAGGKNRIQSQYAEFEFESPVNAVPGGTWSVTLDQQYGSNHVLGIFRLSLGTKQDVAASVALKPEQRMQAAFEKWQQKESDSASPWTVLKPESIRANIAFFRTQEDGSIHALGDSNKSETYELSFKAPITGVTAMRIEAIPDDRLPEGGPGRAYYEGRKGLFFLSELTARTGDKPVTFSQSTIAHDGKAAGSAAVCYDGNTTSGWSGSGTSGVLSQAVFNFAQPVDLSKGLSLTMLFERHFVCSLGHFRISFTTDTGKVVAQPHPAPVQALLAKAAAERSASENQLLLEQFLEVTPELASARKPIDDLRRALKPGTKTLVLRERPADQPRSTHIHHRGEYTQPTDAVEPGVLSVLHSLPQGAERNRLTFARWLVDPANPLVARVVINRQWQAIFGRGLVRTTEDFGVQGEVPVQQDLLDWLAIEFVRRGWSLKAMHKLIVTSATYRQGSAVSAALLEKDPENRLLGRSPRLRLDAELVRDSLLRASGLLSEKMYGPSVYPPQPESVTEGVYGGMSWPTSQGEDRYRRGLYTYTKRSAPFAMAATFDAPTGEACITRRESSNTPLQALTMLNDQTVFEASQAMAKALVAMDTDDAGRLTELFRRTLSRPCTDFEREVLLGFHHQQLARLRQGKLKAEPIAGEGKGDAASRAAWVLTSRAVFNLDEVVTRE